MLRFHFKRLLITRIPILLILLVLLKTVSGGVPKELKLFDAGNNLLLKVLFEYGADQTVVARTVVDANDYVISKTTLSGEREEYRDDNGDLKHYVTHENAGANKTVSIFNEFDMLLFRDTYSKTGTDNVFTFEKSGTAEYLYEGDNISRINIKNTAGTVTHHASMEYQDLSAKPRLFSSAAVQVTSVQRLPRGSVLVSFHLKARNSLSVSMFNIKGEEAGKIFNKPFPKGFHTVIIDTGKNAQALQHGVYIMDFNFTEGSGSFKMKVIK